MSKQIVLGMSGASGAAYAVRLLDVLLSGGHDVALVVSPAAQAVFKTELEIDVDLDVLDVDQLLADGRRRLAEMGAAPLSAASRRGRVNYYHYQNLMAPIASGSHPTQGMVICPCSGGTTSAIAHAASTNLLHRAADVHLKERRPLVLVPRETPLSTIQLENLQRCAQAGAVVLPAMPGWYHAPKTLADLVDFIVARICDQLHVEQSLAPRWGSETKS